MTTDKTKCEYCGTALPLGSDKGTRRVRTFHFQTCEAKLRQQEQEQAHADFGLSCNLKEACENIDAAVFSGDTLYSKAARTELLEYVQRWQRAIDAHNEEDDNG